MTLPKDSCAVRFAYALPALIFAGLIFYFSSQEHVDLPLEEFAFNDKILHAAAYFVFGLTLLFAAYPTKRLTTRTWSAYAIILAIGMAYGISDEIHQAFVPNRDCSLGDFSADAIGVAAALGGHFLWRLRNRKRSLTRVRLPDVH